MRYLLFLPFLTSCATANLHGPCLYNFYKWEEQDNKYLAAPYRGWVTLPQFRLKDACAIKGDHPNINACTPWARDGYVYSMYTEEEAKQRHSRDCRESLYSHEVYHVETGRGHKPE